jgi:hypothetical protein
LVVDPVLLYAGYIGGAGQDFGNAITIDSDGYVYVVGYTDSNQASFPVTIGPDLTYNSGQDAFVAKLTPDGTQLVYSGYIGGVGQEFGMNIAVDEVGNAYLVGYTNSDETTFPVRMGPDLSYNGSQDAFVAKLSADGANLLYAGYIGGAGDDFGHGIAVDGGGNLYVVGITGSSEATFPVTVGPDLSFNGPPYDSFVAKVNAAGTGLVYAGYIGGSGDDALNTVAVERACTVACAAYVTGSTASDHTTFPVVAGPDLSYNGGTDAFVAKLKGDGTGFVYAGYIGGSGADYLYSIAVDGGGNAYVYGNTDSTEATFPVTVGPGLTYQGGRYDAFVAKLNATGTALIYNGYIGGAGDEFGRGVAVDDAGNAYVTGWTSSTEATFPVLGGPDLTYNGGPSDVFVAKVNTAGTALEYAGYIGGSSEEMTGHANPIAVDPAGTASYIIGSTSSNEATFPVTVGPDLTFNGAYDSFVAKVSDTPVSQPPTAAFSWFPQVQDEGAPVQFMDLSTSGLGTIQSWHWDFAGLGTSSNQNPSFTFTDNVLYNVCLTVTDAPGSGTPAHTIIEFERNAPFPGEDNTPWLRGDVILGSVPFRIPETDPSVWKSEDPFVTGPNPRILDVLINQMGVDRVYTLINTGGGAPGPTAYAWLEFWGDGGAYYRKDLVGDVDIRDYNYDGWTNAINGTTTVNVFLHNPGVYNGERRLDMQIIDLPEEFHTQILTQMRLSDNGGDNLQRTILEGVTVQADTLPTGNTDTVCQDITINNVAPVVNAVSNDGPITEGGSATITVDASDPAGLNDPLSYEFDCDNNGSFEVGPQAGNSAACTFGSAGSFPVIVRVTDGDGGEATSSTLVTVNSAPPTVVELIAAQDSFVRSGNDNTNEGANPNLVIRSDGNNRALVNFDLAGLSSPVNSAHLRLYIVYNADNWGNEGRTIDTHRVTQAWSEGNGANLQPGNLTNAQFRPYENRGNGPGVTWKCATDTDIHNQASDCNPKWNGGLYVATPTDSVRIYKDFAGNNQLPPTTSTLGWITFDITADLNTCLTQGATQCSWLIKKTQEGQSGRVEFASREGAATFYNNLAGEPVAPQLMISTVGANAASTSAPADSDSQPNIIFLPLVER